MADGAANPLPVPTGASKTPSDFLKSIKGKPVLVKLNSGVDYRGRQPNTTAGDGPNLQQPGLPACPQRLSNHCSPATSAFCRHPCVSRRLHEHCHGAHRGEQRGKQQPQTVPLKGGLLMSSCVCPDTAALHTRTHCFTATLTWDWQATHSRSSDPHASAAHTHVTAHAM